IPFCQEGQQVSAHDPGSLIHCTNPKPRPAYAKSRRKSPVIGNHLHLEKANNPMKTFLHTSGCLVAATILVLGFSGCDDDSGPSLPRGSAEYTLNPRSHPAIRGNVTFSKQSDNCGLLTIQLRGPQGGGNHPAHIHAGNAVGGGTTVLALATVY